MSLQRTNGGMGTPISGMELVDRFLDRADEARKMAEKTEDEDHRMAAYAVMRRYLEMAAEEIGKMGSPLACAVLALVTLSLANVLAAAF